MYSPETYRPRILDEKIDLYLSAIDAVAIVGPRWTGKTTTGQAHAKSEISLADSSNNFSNRRLAQASPDFVLKGEQPRLIDEWQEVPAIWDAVRYECDANSKFGKYILTGSSLASVNSEEYFHSGTGRIAPLTMNSMTLYETGDSSGVVSLKDLFNNSYETMPVSRVEIDQLVRYCIRGGWPKSISSSVEASRITPIQYIDTVIEEDFNRLPFIGRKRPTGKIRAVAEALASFESTACGVSDIATYISEKTEFSLTRQSIPSYIEGFSKLFIIYQQPAFTIPSSKTGSKLLKSAKLRFSDPSLAIAALRLTPEDLLNDIDMLSRFFDCLCAHDIKIYAESLDATYFHLVEEHGASADSLVKMRDGRVGCFKHVVSAADIDSAVQQLARVKKILSGNGVNCPLLCIVCGMANAVYTVKTADGEDVVITPLTALKP